MFDPIWTCRDGRKMRVGQMDDRHLSAAIAMIMRSRRGWRAHWLPRLVLEQEIRKLRQQGLLR